MAISKKNKNRALVDGKEYFWWVFNEIDQTEFDGIQIKAVCSDQTHFFKYGLQQGKNRKLVLALNNCTKLVHLQFAPKFENDDGIITRSGIVKMVRWSRQKEYKIHYALDNMNNNLTLEQQRLLLNELQSLVG